MQIDRDIPLAPFTTLGIGGRARFYARAQSVADAIQALGYARERRLPVFLLGGGSNLVVPDEGFAGLVLHIALPATFEQVSADTLEVSAGTDWDSLVRATCERGLAGMECLAGIPGLVGASPIQNIGAYGQDAAQTIASVRVIDRTADRPQEQELSAAQCGFSYRHSIFNSTCRDRYLITSVRFCLRPHAPPSLEYADLAALRDTDPTLLQVYHHVRAIRDRKGMLIEPGKPTPDTRSAGSFFKNPIVATAVRECIGATLGLSPAQVPGWPAGDRLKLPAAWLIERAGFPKGYAIGPGSLAAISTRHTLALTNRSGTATCADLYALRDRICDRVQTLFGIALEQEPVVML